MRYLLTTADHEFAVIERDAEKRIEELDEMLKGNEITIDEYDMAIDAIKQEIEIFHNI